MSLLKVYGLEPPILKRLQVVAEKRLGKASVSALAKSLLLEVLGDATATTVTTPLVPRPVGMADEELAKERTVIRLQAPEKQYLAAAAAQYGTSVNCLVRQIIQSYISKNPALSAAEVDALYQSNYQLLRISMQPNMQLVPAVSAHRLMVTIRMMRREGEKMLHAGNVQAGFELALCS